MANHEVLADSAHYGVKRENGFRKAQESVRFVPIASQAAPAKSPNIMNGNACGNVTMAKQGEKKSIIIKQMGRVTISVNQPQMPKSEKAIDQPAESRDEKDDKVAKALNARLQTMREVFKIKPHKIPIPQSRSIEKSGVDQIKDCGQKKVTSQDANQGISLGEKANYEAQILKLQRQNHAFRNMLLDCRLNINQLQFKMRRMTVGINNLLQAYPPSMVTPETVPRKRALNDSTGSDYLPPFKKINISQQIEPVKMPKAPTSPSANNQPIVLPIRSLEMLKIFESRLSERKYFAVMINRLTSTLPEGKIANLDSARSYILRNLIMSEILIHIPILGDNYSANDACFYSKFRSFYACAINALCRACFGRSINPKAISHDLDERILAQHRNKNLEKIKKTCDQLQQFTKAGTSIRIIVPPKKIDPPVMSMASATENKIHAPVNTKPIMKPTEVDSEVSSKNIELSDDEEDYEVQEDFTIGSCFLDNDDNEESIQSICEEQEFQFSE